MTNEIWIKGILSAISKKKVKFPFANPDSIDGLSTNSTVAQLRIGQKQETKRNHPQLIEARKRRWRKCKLVKNFKIKTQRTLSSQSCIDKELYNGTWHHWATKRAETATTHIDLQRYWTQNTYCCQSNFTLYQGRFIACPSCRFEIKRHMNDSRAIAIHTDMTKDPVQWQFSELFVTLDYKSRERNASACNSSLL